MTKEVMNWNNKIGGKKAERIPCPDGVEGCLVAHYKVIEEQTKQEQETPKCKTHPDAPHGFVRNASHSEDRYVCECEFWQPPEQDEPVATLIEHYAFTDGIVRFDGVKNMEQLPVGTKLYTKPQTKKWVKLTEYDIKGVLGLSESWVGEDCSIPDMIGFAKAIQAKLKAKNGY